MTVSQMDLIWHGRWGTENHNKIGISANGRWKGNWKGGGEEEP